MYQDTQQSGSTHDEKDGQRKWELQDGHGGDSKIRTAHHEHALGEIEHIRGFENHSESQSHQTINAAQSQTAEKDLFKHGDASGFRY